VRCWQHKLLARSRALLGRRLLGTPAAQAIDKKDPSEADVPAAVLRPGCRP